MVRLDDVRLYFRCLWSWIKLNFSKFLTLSFLQSIITVASDYINPILHWYAWLFLGTIISVLIAFILGLRDVRKSGAVTDLKLKAFCFSLGGVITIGAAFFVQHKTDKDSALKALTDIAKGAAKDLTSIKEILERGEPVASPATDGQFFANAFIFDQRGQGEQSLKAIETLYSKYDPQRYDSALLFARALNNVNGAAVARARLQHLAREKNDFRLLYASAAIVAGNEAGAMQTLADRYPSCLLCAIAATRRPEEFCNSALKAATTIDRVAEARSRKVRADAQQALLNTLGAKLDQFGAAKEFYLLGLTPEWFAYRSSVDAEIPKYVLEGREVVQKCDAQLTNAEATRAKEMELLPEYRRRAPVSFNRALSDPNAGLVIFNFDPAVQILTGEFLDAGRWREFASDISNKNVRSPFAKLTGLPVGATIRIKIKLVSGEILGPFSYKVDR